MAELIVNTYANALFDLAKEEEKLALFETEAKGILTLLQENNDFLVVLNHPKISKDEKIALLEEIFSEKVAHELIGFMVIIIKKDRYNELTHIFRRFLDLVQEEKGIVTAFIKSAVALSDVQKQAVEERLTQLTQKTVETKYTVDPQLIGGLVIRIGDRIVDNSIKGRMDRMAKELLKVQLA